MSGSDGRDGFGAAAAVGSAVAVAAAAAVGGRGYSPWLSAGSGPGRQGGNEQQIWPTHPGRDVYVGVMMMKSGAKCRCGCRRVNWAKRGGV